jgi:uncharacterized membrane protein YdbT with pleckstrin-like domain
VSYFDKVLQPGERVLIRGRLHWVIYLPAYLAFAAALIIAVATYVALKDPNTALAGYGLAGLVLVYGIVVFIGRMIRRMSTEFGVTDHRIIVKRGLVSLHTIEMSVDKVESVDVDQSILGRMLGYGAVTIHGVGARWDPLPGMADPIGFRNAITTRTAPVAA